MNAHAPPARLENNSDVAAAREAQQRRGDALRCSASIHDAIRAEASRKRKARVVGADDDHGRRAERLADEQQKQADRPVAEHGDDAAGANARELARVERDGKRLCQRCSAQRHVRRDAVQRARGKHDNLGRGAVAVHDARLCARRATVVGAGGAARARGQSAADAALADDVVADAEARAGDPIRVHVCACAARVGLALADLGDDAAPLVAQRARVLRRAGRVVDQVAARNLDVRAADADEGHAHGHLAAAGARHGHAGERERARTDDAERVHQRRVAHPRRGAGACAAREERRRQRQAPVVCALRVSIRSWRNQPCTPAALSPRVLHCKKRGCVGRRW